METVGDVMTSRKVFFARPDTTIDEGEYALLKIIHEFSFVRSSLKLLNYPLLQHWRFW